MDEETIHVPLIVCTKGRAEYSAPGGKIANHVSTIRVVNDIITDYAHADKEEYSEVRAALDAGAFPDHPVVSALNWISTNEAGCIYRHKDGNIKYRVFYRDNGSVVGEKAFAIGADGALARVEVTNEIRQAIAKGLKNQRPPKAIIDKDSEENLKALGYHHG